MKKLGIIGGLGPASTVDYYNGILAQYRATHSADEYPELLIYSVNMSSYALDIENGSYEALAKKVIRDVDILKAGGADFAAIASNSPHIAWDYFSGKTAIPVISIIDAVCDYITEKGYKKVLVFATAFTMRNGLYANVLKKRGIDFVVPNENDIDELGSIIYPNLENGIVIEKDKARMIAIAERYIKECHCDSLLLGCTEIPLMIKSADIPVPLINSTQVHINKISKLICE